MLPATLLAEIESSGPRLPRRREELFADRLRRGAILDGHGDLTLDDTFCLPDGPRLLDCLEFDDDVADRLGMVVLSSDRLRKEAAGIDPESHAAADFGAGLYCEERTRATYASMLHRAELLLRRGGPRAGSPGGGAVPPRRRTCRRTDPWPWAR